MARIGKYVAESQPRQSYEPGIEQADQSKMHRLAQPKIRQTRKDNVIFLINTVGPSGKYERYKKLQNDIFSHTRRRAWPFHVMAVYRSRLVRENVFGPPKKL